MGARALAALLAGVSLSLGLAAATLAQGTDPTPQVFDVTPTTAQVTSVVEPPGDVGSYHFEWGTDGSYSTHSDPIALGIEPGARAVGGTITGLVPSTTYWVRVVVTGAGDPVVSQGVAFTTSADPTPSPPDPTPPPAELQPRETTETTPPDPEEAVLGEAVVVGTESGTITVKQAGTDEYATLEAGAPVPVGSLVDATDGIVRLITETSGGDTQDVLLRGAKFEVRQASGSGGMTDLVLRGGDFGVCGRAQSAGASARKPRRSLWAKDRGGRFRTRGRDSVATVRGTTWRTTDTCNGTTTSVLDGAVVVRELRSGRKVLVREGRRHLARAAR